MSRFLLSCANRCGAAFVLALLVGPMVLAEEIYYQVGFTNRLRLADTDVGTDVLIGSMGPADDSLGMSFSPEGVLYGYNRSTSSLYTIDTTTAATTLVGANGLQAVESLTFDATGSTLYATSGSQLYAMDPADATATLIGALGTSLDGLTVSPVPLDVFGIGTVPAGTIFGIDTRELFLVDVVTPSTTSIGSVSANETLAFGPTGTLFGHDGGAFYEIDLATLNSTLLQNTPDNLVFASAIPRIPEPATWVLLLGGNAWLLCTRTRLRAGRAMRT